LHVWGGPRVGCGLAAGGFAQGEASRRPAAVPRGPVRAAVESLEARCLLSGTAHAVETASVPWAGAAALTTSDPTLPTVSIYADVPGNEEGPQDGTFRVHRDYPANCGCGCGCGGGIDSSLTVDYSFDVANSTATSGQDFYPFSGNVTFQPGQADAYVPLQVNDDQQFEDTESVKVDLVDTGGRSTTGSPIRPTIRSVRRKGSTPSN
jgi:Calx-beta domain-containing protein